MALPDLVARLRFALDQASLARAQTGVEGFARRVEVAGDTTGSALEGATAKLSAQSSGLERSLGKITTALTSRLGPAGAAVKTQLDTVGTSALEGGSALSLGLGAGAVAGGLLLTKFAADGVSALQRITAEVREFKRVSGASAEDSSRFVASFSALGIDTTQAAKSIGILSSNIALAPKKLAEFGVAVAKNKDGTTNLSGTLLNLADAYKRTTDQAQRNALARGLLGRGGLDLIPILARGREGLQEFWDEAERHGLIFDDRQLQQNLELKLALHDLQQSLVGIEILGAKALVPLITDVAKLAEKAAGLVQFIDKHTPGGLVSSIEEALPGVGPLFAAQHQFDRATAGSKSAKAVAAATGPLPAGITEATSDNPFQGTNQVAELGQFGITAGDVAKVLNDLAKSQDARRVATLAAVSAQVSDERATASFSAAVADIADKERALAIARRDRTDAGREAITVERALNSVEDAKTSVVDRERELADARAGRGRKATELAAAERDLAKAQQEAGAAHGINALADSSQRLADAQDRLRRAQEDGGKEADVADATKALSRAQLDVRDTTLSLSEVRQRASDQQEAAAAAVASAETALFTSRENAKAAAISEASAAQTLAEKQAEAAGRTLTAAQSYDVFRSKLIELRDSATDPALRAALDGVVAQLGTIPDAKTTTLTVDTAAATAHLKGLKDLLDTFTVDAIQLDIATVVDQAAAAGSAPVPIIRHPHPSFHTGGLVAGAGREVPAVLETGEFVIRRSSVALLGVDALERLNRGGARLPRFHDGGLVGAGGLDLMARIPDVSSISDGAGVVAELRALRTVVANLAGSPSSTTNNTTTVHALGANADVARAIDIAQARAASRAG